MHSKALHYRGSYYTRSENLRVAANADLSTRCWRCGRLSAELERDPSLGPWQAGHLRDGDATSPLMPEHRKCNASAGARLRVDGFRTSRDW